MKTHAQLLAVFGCLQATTLCSLATVTTLEYSSPWDGPVHPGTAPFLTATLSDAGPASTSVNFLLQPSNLDSGEYVNTWAFNFSGAVSGLTFLFVPPPTGFDLPTLEIPAGNLGGGNPPFDFSLSFSTDGSGGGAHRFEAGESLSFTVFRSGGGVLTVDDFLESFSFKNQELTSGVFFAGAGGSYHYKSDGLVPPPPPPPIPESATMAFGGLLVAGLTARELRLAARNRRTA